MGMFKWPIQIETVDGLRSITVEATADTGAAYTVLPSRLLHELGVKPKGRRVFLLADGSRIDGAYGEARATINGDTENTIVIFGADDGPVLLGAYTLEGLSLAVDPVNQRVVPTVLTL